MQSENVPSPSQRYLSRNTEGVKTSLHQPRHFHSSSCIFSSVCDLTMRCVKKKRHLNLLFQLQYCILHTFIHFVYAPMSHPIPHWSLKHSCQKLFSLKPFNVLGGEGGQVLRCLLFCLLAFCWGFFQQRRENIKNTEERKSFPDNTSEQGNAMADIHPRKIKETFKQKVPFHLIFSQQEMARIVKQ